MKYKLIVSDFDDTILKEDLTYSSELKRQIAEYEKLGGRFTIATGRMVSGILPYARQLGIHGDLICFQGGIVVDTESGDIIETTLIEYKDVLEIAKDIESKGLYYQLYDEDYFIVEEENYFSKIYGGFCHATPLVTHKPLVEYIQEKVLSTVKIVIMTDPDDIGDLITYYTEKFGEKVLVNTSKPWMIEMVSKNINKGLAVLRLAEKYGIRQDEVIAIGDSQNDVTMLKAAGLGVAVENGSPLAKAAADLIAPSVEDNGVGYIIEKYGMER